MLTGCVVVNTSEVLLECVILLALLEGWTTVDSIGSSSDVSNDLILSSESSLSLRIESLVIESSENKRI